VKLTAEWVVHHWYWPALFAVLGPCFCLADFYLSFWIALLDPDGVCKLFPFIAKLYDLLRSRSNAQRHLERAESMAEEYAELMKKNPEGVIT